MAEVVLKMVAPVKVTAPMTSDAPLVPVRVSVLAPEESELMVRTEEPGAVISSTSTVESAKRETLLAKVVLESLRRRSVPLLSATPPPSDCPFWSSTMPPLICSVPLNAGLAPGITRAPLSVL